jgi:hypothetical protein
LDRFVEEIVFRRPEASHLLQLADFAAFAHLKSVALPPSPFIKKWGYHALFEKLRPVFLGGISSDVREAGG